MFDTCSLFPPFGDLWSSCRLPSQEDEVLPWTQCLCFPANLYVESWPPRWWCQEVELPGWYQCPYRREPRKLPVPPFKGGHSKKMPSVNQEESPHQTLGLLKPWSWLSSLQNCEKQMSVYISHPDYDIFVMAAEVDRDIAPTLLHFLPPSPPDASFSKCNWKPVRRGICQLQALGE